MFADFLNALQRNTSRGYSSLIDRLLGNSVEREFSGRNSPYARFASRDAEIIRNGRVVWAAIVIANDRLFAPAAEADSAALIVFSPTNYFDSNPGHLCKIATDLANLRTEGTSDPELHDLARIVADDHGSPSNLLLPWKVTDGHEVYLTRINVYRSCLPKAQLTDQLIPVVICPQSTFASIIPPARLWPRPFVKQLGRIANLLVMATNDCKSGPSRLPATPMPQAPAYHPAGPLLTDQLFEVTDAAAAVLVKHMRDDSSRVYVRVGASWTGKSFEYHLDFASVATRDDRVIQTKGIEVVIDEDQLKLLEGTVLDYQDSGGIVGFRFNNPNAVKPQG